MESWCQMLQFPSGADVSVSEGLIMTSTDEHLTDMKCILVYCVKNYSLYSNYLWKLDTAAYI